MPVPEFVGRDGQMTADGKKLSEFIEAQFSGAKDVTTLNGLAGPFKHYYVDVVKLGVTSREQWLADYSNSFARNAWGILEHVEAQAAAVAKTEAVSEAVGDVASELKKLKESLTKEIAALKGENTKLRKQVAALREEGALLEPVDADEPDEAEVVDEDEA